MATGSRVALREMSANRVRDMTATASSRNRTRESHARTEPRFEKKANTPRCKSGSSMVSKAKLPKWVMRKV